MKCKTFLIILFLGIYAVFSQNPLVDTTAEEGDTENISGKPSGVGEEQTDDFENPFLSEDKEVSAQEETITEDSTETTSNPFLAEEEGGVPAEEPEAGFEQGGVDILLDLGVGVSLSYFTVKPDYINTEMKPDFLFQPAMIIPFARLFYGSIALRYLRVSLKMSYNLTSFSNTETITISENTDELLSYISVPCKVGMRFNVGIFTPYFYTDVEPAYLSSAEQYIKSEKEIIYASGVKFVAPETEDRNTTDYRERLQLFAGGGIGLDISYGYGSVYIDGGIQVALLDTDHGDGLEVSRPYRTSVKFIYFPITIGIRFYL